MVTRHGGWLEGELDEGSQNVQIPIIRQINTKDVMYNMINIINTAVCYILCESCLESKSYEFSLRKKIFSLSL